MICELLSFINWYHSAMIMKPRIIIHVDQDSFYASVEARDNPLLRGKPLIIGSLPTERGVVATCSYEARKFGVRSAMSIKDAYRLCPNGIYMHPNYEKYKHVSDQLHEIWAVYTDIIEYMSLDEGYLDLTHILASLPTLKEQVERTRKIADEIKHRTRTEIGLTCSVGIGYSMTSAKLASEEKKPDGYFEIWSPEAFTALILDRDIRVLYGIGKKTSEKLKAEGLHTVRDIQNNQPKVLGLLGNKIGRYIVDLSLGIDERAVTPYDETDAKSIAREVTFQHDTTNFYFLKDVLMLLAVSLESRLQRLGFYARTVTLKVTYYNMKTVTRSQSSENTNQAYEIFITAFNLFNRLNETQTRMSAVGVQNEHREPRLTSPIRLIGISLQNLNTSRSRQLTFDDIDKKWVQYLHARWDKALQNLERKYDIKIPTDRRGDIYMRLLKSWKALFFVVFRMWAMTLELKP